MMQIGVYEMPNNTTTIRIKLTTKKDFEKLGFYGETHDDILTRLIKQQLKALNKALRSLYKIK